MVATVVSIFGKAKEAEIKLHEADLQKRGDQDNYVLIDVSTALNVATAVQTLITEKQEYVVERVVEWNSGRLKNVNRWLPKALHFSIAPDHVLATLRRMSNRGAKNRAVTAYKTAIQLHTREFVISHQLQISARLAKDVNQLAISVYKTDWERLQKLLSAGPHSTPVVIPMEIKKTRPSRRASTP